MIKGIIFDLGGVIVSDAVIHYLNDYTDFTAVLDLTKVSREEAGEIWKKHWPKMKYGEEDLDDFWKEFYTHVKEKIPLDKIKELYNSKIIINKEVLEFANKLKIKYLLYALANESKTGMDLKIEKFKIDKVFNKIYCSAHLGMAKPNKDIFEFVLKDINLKAEDVIFIDNQEGNFNTAKELGMKSILFKNLEQLKKDLSELGIK